MQRRPPELLLAALVLLASRAPARGAQPAGGGDGLLDAGGFSNRKEPIHITSDNLEYDYKANVVVYRGDVVAIQGETKVRSDTLTVTLVATHDGNGTPPATSDPVPPGASSGGQKVQEIVAVGNVRIDDGSRWATGGRAVFEQSSRTLVLTETPVLHDGPNEVAGDRVIVYLDENRSEVQGGRKRVKAVVYPGKDGGLTPAQPATGTTTAAAGTTAKP
ncbi:MAG TPA: LptA/OstA family protein [Candidatus Binatia bacterium]|nr:LptA/OstA family protein [Candidatus Binatia bacterium]